MRPLLPALIVAAVFAAAPSTAIAKGIERGQVCGQAGCQDVEPSSYFALLADGTPADPPSAPTPFYTVNVTMSVHGPGGAPPADMFDYLPSLGLTHASRAQANTGWVKLSNARRRALDRLVAPIEPHPAAQLAGFALPDAVADDGPPRWPITAAALAGLVLLGLLARYATRALKARRRSAKSAS